MKTPEEFLIDQQGWSEMKKKYKGISDAIEGLCEDYAKYYHQEKIKEMMPSDEEIVNEFSGDLTGIPSELYQDYAEEFENKIEGAKWLKNKLLNQQLRIWKLITHHALNQLKYLA